jgi:hypothetical protein
MMRFLVERGATYDKKDVWIESVVTGKDLEELLAERREKELFSASGPCED